MALAQGLPMPSSLLSDRPPASQQLRARTSATSEVPSVVLTRFESLSAELRIRWSACRGEYAAGGVTPRVWAERVLSAVPAPRAGKVRLGGGPEVRLCGPLRLVSLETTSDVRDL